MSYRIAKLTLLYFAANQRNNLKFSRANDLLLLCDANGMTEKLENQAFMSLKIIYGMSEMQKKTKSLISSSSFSPFVEPDFHKLSKNLSKLMFDSNIDSPKLSKYTNVPVATINRLRANPASNPTLASLLPIANYFSISINQLIGIEEIPKDRAPGTFDPAERLETPVPFIPLDKLIHWKDFQRVADTVSSENVFTSAKVTPLAFATQMNSHAMFPKFPDKTMFIVEPSVQAQDQDFVVVKMEYQKDISVKQLFIDGGDYYFKTINPEFDKLIHSNSSEIFGVIIEAVIRYER